MEAEKEALLKKFCEVLLLAQPPGNFHDSENYTFQPGVKASMSQSLQFKNTNRHPTY
jgi:hypothetical protein